MALDSAGHVNLRDVTIDSGVLVVALVNDGRTERVADLGVGAGQRVIKANSKSYIVWNAEALG